MENVVKQNDQKETKHIEQGSEIYQTQKKTENTEATNQDQEIIQSQIIFEKCKQLGYQIIKYLITYEGKHQDALKLFDKALMKDPNNQEIQIWKGQALSLIFKYFFCQLIQKDFKKLTNLMMKPFNQINRIFQY